MQSIYSNPMHDQQFNNSNAKPSFRIGVTLINLNSATESIELLEEQPNNMKVKSVDNLELDSLDAEVERKDLEEAIQEIEEAAESQKRYLAFAASYSNQLLSDIKPIYHGYNTRSNNGRNSKIKKRKVAQQHQVEQSELKPEEEVSDYTDSEEVRENSDYHDESDSEADSDEITAKARRKPTKKIKTLSGPHIRIKLNKSGRPVERRSKLPLKSVYHLRSWFTANVSSPYPTLQEKKKLAAETNLSIKQINNFFTNTRRRFWQPFLRKVATAQAAKELQKSVHNNIDLKSLMSSMSSTDSVSSGSRGSSDGGMSVMSNSGPEKSASIIAAAACAENDIETDGAVLHELDEVEKKGLDMMKRDTEVQNQFAAQLNRGSLLY
jgi:hypothetical protein